MRKRNFKLSKILKPKNAVAILNELIKDLNYEIEIISNRSDGRTFRASVNYDGIIHEGFGKLIDLILILCPLILLLAYNKFLLHFIVTKKVYSQLLF